MNTSDDRPQILRYAWVIRMLAQAFDIPVTNVTTEAGLEPIHRVRNERDNESVSANRHGIKVIFYKETGCLRFECPEEKTAAAIADKISATQHGSVVTLLMDRGIIGQSSIDPRLAERVPIGS